MDSLSQLVLGAAVGEAVLGRKAGNKAILWGAVGGTIPDLDVFIAHFFSPVDAMALHRGFSHSLVFCILAAPLLGWLIQKVHKKINITAKEWSWLMFWVLVTHPLLDCFTAWGTQLFWPFEWRIAIESVFVIDPLYTIPFLLLLLVAMFFNRESKTRRRLNTTGLILSTTYLLWGVFAQQQAENRFRKDLNARNISYTSLKAKAMPITTFYWQGIAETEEGFYLGSYSLFDNEKSSLKWKYYARKNELIATHNLSENPHLIKLMQLTNHHLCYEAGYGDSLKVCDVRFGRTDVVSTELKGEWLFHFYFKSDGNTTSIVSGRARGEIAKMNMNLYFKRIFGQQFRE